MEHPLQQHWGGGAAGESPSFPEVLPRHFGLSKFSQLQEESVASVLTPVAPPGDSPMFTRLNFHELHHPFLRALLLSPGVLSAGGPPALPAPPIHYPTPWLPTQVLLCSLDFGFPNTSLSPGSLKRSVTVGLLFLFLLLLHTVLIREERWAFRIKSWFSEG